MKAGQTRTEIDHNPRRHKSSIGWGEARESGRRGCGHRQGQNLSDERSQSSRSAVHIDEQSLIQVGSLFSLQ